jgi:hypothetical protein
VIMQRSEERSGYCMRMYLSCSIGTDAREAGGEAWNFGQNVAFGPGQSKALIELA